MPLTSLLLILVPLLGGLLVSALPANVAKPVAGAIALLIFGYFAAMLQAFEPTGGLQYAFSSTWVPDLGLQFAIGLDGINLIPMLLNTMLVPAIIFYARPTDYRLPNMFFGLILLMQAGMACVFLAQSAFLFYLGWEAALIPIFFITGVWGSEGRQRITLKFFIYTIASSLFMLLAFLYLYTFTGGSIRDSFGAMMAAGQSLPAETQGWLFWAIFIAFAVKMPIFPFHTWQPDTYTVSPAPGTMLLAGIMLKMGIYGCIKWLLPIVPQGVEMNQSIVLTLSVAGIVYGSVIAIMQSDIKRLVAYSSFAHVGLMAAAVFALNQEGLTGAMVQMLSHGITIVGMFAVLDIVEKGTGRRELYGMAGLTKDSPSTSVYFLIMVLGSVALPLTSGFVGEFMMLLSLSRLSLVLALVAGTTVILSAVYMLRLYQGVMLGEKPESALKLRPLALNDNVVLIALSILVFWLGVYPSPFIDLIEPSVNLLLQQAGR
jgi:NADH-quinone oxidoreductase subunit M